MSAIEYYRDEQLPIFELKSCEAGVHASRMHAHEEYSFGFILNGASTVGGAGRDRTVKAGDAIVIPPGQMHDCRPESVRDWRSRMLFLNQPWLERAVGARRVSSLCIKSLNADEIRHLLALYDVLRGGVTALEKESRLIWTICHLFDLPAQHREALSGNAGEAPLMARVADYIQANYLERITLDDLAGLANLNKYSLLRSYQRIHQTSPHMHQTMLRINYAKRELRAAPERSIAAIAMEAGFYDQSHFGKVFRLYTGTTPLGYRLGRT